jgi:hypothetical protein
MRVLVAGGDVDDLVRGIALIDPRSRRRDWLIASPLEGRRTLAPYRDSADARLAMSA